MCENWLGSIGLVLAILGVVAAPMSTGGTAFRCARLIIADFTHIGQHTLVRRVMLVAPVFVVAALMLAMKFDVLWRYVSWLNQCLATFTFLAIAHWLLQRSRQDGIWKWSWFIAFLPGIFMLAVSSSFILIAPEGLQIPHTLGYGLSVAVTACATCLFLWHCRQRH